MDMKYLRERVEARTIIVTYIPRKVQKTHVLTIVLDSRMFVDQWVNLVTPVLQD